MDNKQLLKQAGEALQAMLEDYRSEGCPDPNCRVCRESQAAVKMAKTTIAKISSAIAPERIPYQ